MEFPEIPKSWLIALLILGLCILRAYNIDTFITAGIAALIGYVTGKHIEQTKEEMIYNEEQ